MQLTRREFLCGAVAGGAMLALPRPLRAQGVGSYSVPVLGDIHFDSPDPKFYHANYTHSTSQKRYKAHLAEHVRNSEMWKERLPRFVRASGACLRKDAAFALQMGDLVQGDCGNAATHRRMLDDAFAFLKGAYGGNLPLVTVAGNHDIRGAMKGDGARETLEKWLPETMAKELGVPVNGTTFSFRQGPDVFIVVDFNEPRPKLSLIKRLLEESKGARYTFFISHGLVVPNSLSRWFLLGEEKRDAERRELCSLLARRNAIVLCGHTHRMELLECEFPEGQITQFTFNSVWTNPAHAVPAIISEGAGAFGEGGFLKEYKPFVRRFMLARAAGHYWLRVSDRGVGVAFYGGDTTTPSRTFRLR
jgi:predicted phosphodiesterase